MDSVDELLKVRQDGDKVKSDIQSIQAEVEVRVEKGGGGGVLGVQ